MLLITLKIEGMHCSMCESHINDIIRKVNGTSKIKSSHLRNESKFLLKSEDSLQTIINNIEKEGYKVISINKENYVKKGLFPFFKK